MGAFAQAAAESRAQVLSFSPFPKPSVTSSSSLQAAAASLSSSLQAAAASLSPDESMQQEPAESPLPDDKNVFGVLDKFHNVDWEKASQEMMSRKRTLHEADAPADFAVDCDVGDDAADKESDYTNILLELPEDVCARLAQYSRTEREAMLNAYLNYHLSQLPEELQNDIRGIKGNYRKFMALKQAWEEVMQNN